MEKHFYKPYIIVASRTIFLILAQSIVALIFYFHGNDSPWKDSAAWYTIYGTVADLGCLSLLIPFCITEQISFKQLLHFRADRLLNDIITGIGLFILVFPLLGMGISSMFGKLMFADVNEMYYKGMLLERVLPTWARFYSFFIWLPIWSMVEELSYQGYGASNIKENTGKDWLAILYVSFWFTLQHSFFPMILDVKYLVYRFISFFPMTSILVLYFVKKGKLIPVLVAHYIMDFMVVWWTIKK